MFMYKSRIWLLGGLVCSVLLMASPIATAQLVNPTNGPDTRTRDDASEMARKVMTTAELSIKASDRTLSVMLWMLGICLGSSTLGIAGLWVWISAFRRKMRKEMSESQSNADKLLEGASKTATIFEQILCSLPMLFIDGIDDGSKVIALNTLAQLKRPELGPIFDALLNKTTDTRVQAAAVYALGLLEKGAASWKGTILRLSTNPDFSLRRECARALIALGLESREVRMRIEEMARDADDIVKELARKGIERSR